MSICIAHYYKEPHLESAQIQPLLARGSQSYTCRFHPHKPYPSLLPGCRASPPFDCYYPQHSGSLVNRWSCRGAVFLVRSSSLHLSLGLSSYVRLDGLWTLHLLYRLPTYWTVRLLHSLPMVTVRIDVRLFIRLPCL